MKLRKSFVALATAVAGLAGCLQKQPDQMGYVLADDAAVKAMPPESVDVIYGGAGKQFAMIAASPYECLIKARAQYELRDLGISNEESDSKGLATCMGKDGVKLVIYKGYPYVKGKVVLAAPAASAP